MTNDDLHNVLQDRVWYEFSDAWDRVKLAAPAIVSKAAASPVRVECPRRHPLFRVRLNIDDLEPVDLTRIGGLMPRFDVDYLDDGVRISDGLPRDLFGGRPRAISWEERLVIHCPACFAKSGKTDYILKSSKLLRLMFDSVAGNRPVIRLS